MPDIGVHAEDLDLLERALLNAIDDEDCVEAAAEDFDGDQDEVRRRLRGLAARVGAELQRDRNMRALQDECDSNPEYWLL